MLETLRMEYVTTARAPKGLPERDVIFKHAQPNAMIPVVTLAGFQIVGLLGGVATTKPCSTTLASALPLRRLPLNWTW